MVIRYVPFDVIIITITTTAATAAAAATTIINILIKGTLSHYAVLALYTVYEILQEIVY